jgi:predicted metal-dependent hydrolase
VQLRLPWLTRSSTPRVRAPRRHAIDVDGREVPVTIARHRMARRYVVRIDRDGGVRLTVPHGASIAGGLAFATRQADWIARERHRGLERAAPWQPGRQLWLRGRIVVLAIDGGEVRVGGEALGRLAPSTTLREHVERSLRARAAVELIERTVTLAAVHGLDISGVAVRDQRTRWGTCSPNRKIALNWRLIQMPPSVSDYVIYHELMHLRQPNHSRRFWREVEKVCAGWREAERWLRKHGKELQ